mgnify:CR=1 FL=1
MDTPNTQNNTSRMRESRKLEQKRKRQQQVRRQKIFLACSCLILTAGIGLFVTLYHNHQRAAAQEPNSGTDKTKAGSRVAKTAETGK